MTQRWTGIRTGDQPSAEEEEYTAEQRRQIDTELAEAFEGPYFGPFETADAAIEFMNLEIRRRRN